MLGWFRALMPREDRFFDLFERHARTLVAGAEALDELLKGGGDVPLWCGRIAEREQEADEIAREVLEAVRRSFITPFDRGDIKDLIQSMDDAIDQMNRTAKTITLFEVTRFDPVMREMGGTVLEAARLTAEAVPLLNAIGKHSTRLSELTERVVQVEGRSDALHEQGLKALYHGSGRSDPMAYIVGSEILGHLEDVANEISAIVIENV